MWSDHDMIRPHAKYQRRERPGIRSEKKKRRLIIHGIFDVVVVVVVVVVLEAVGWIRRGYTHIQYWIDFCQKCNFDDRPTPTRPDEVDFASLS
jgi:hypothetical protein